MINSEENVTTSDTSASASTNSRLPVIQVSSAIVNAPEQLQAENVAERAKLSLNLDLMAPTASPSPTYAMVSSTSSLSIASSTSPSAERDVETAVIQSILCVVDLEIASLAQQLASLSSQHTEASNKISALSCSILSLQEMQKKEMDSVQSILDTTKKLKVQKTELQRIRNLCANTSPTSMMSSSAASSVSDEVESPSHSIAQVEKKLLSIIGKLASSPIIELEPVAEVKVIFLFSVVTRASPQTHCFFTA